MARMDREAIVFGPRTSTRDPDHVIYPYPLRGLPIDHRDQIWSTDITSIPLERGFMDRISQIDWFRQSVLCWRLSNTLDGRFFPEVWETVQSGGRPANFKTDQGVQFTARGRP
ncbi:hypothetical protein [Tautonia marina]|uniref:hypothetical protein n=1 Tax=Tautonia marina TaxID=2653855 RepID=UPI001260B57E|nr:hypothetical protein [Tautonia marina]